MKDQIQAFRAGLDPALLATVDAVRALITAADARLVEGFKWNAPSFSIDGEDRITLGLERRGGIRIVLHRGVKTNDNSAFLFDDSDRIARWPDPDRGIVLIADAGEVVGKAAKLQMLFTRWIVATA